MSIADNIRKIKENLPETVTLVAVSKNSFFNFFPVFAVNIVSF